MKKICKTLLISLIFCYFPTYAISNNATRQNAHPHDKEQIIYNASNPTSINDINKPDRPDSIFSFEISKGQLDFKIINFRTFDLGPRLKYYI
jgi:hypothetical protein